MRNAARKIFVFVTTQLSMLRALIHNTLHIVPQVPCALSSGSADGLDGTDEQLLYLSDEQLTTLQRMLGFEGKAAVLVWPPAPEPPVLRELVDAVQGMAGDLKAVAKGNYQLNAENMERA